MIAVNGNQPIAIPLTAKQRNAFVEKCARIKVGYGVARPIARIQATQLITALELVRTTPEFFSAYYRALAWLGASLDGGDESLFQTRCDLTEVAERFIAEDSPEC